MNISIPTHHYTYFNQQDGDQFRSHKQHAISRLTMKENKSIIKLCLMFNIKLVYHHVGIIIQSRTLCWFLKHCFLLVERHRTSYLFLQWERAQSREGKSGVPWDSQRRQKSHAVVRNPESPPSKWRHHTGPSEWKSTKHNNRVVSCCISRYMYYKTINFLCVVLIKRRFLFFLSSSCRTKTLHTTVKYSTFWTLGRSTTWLKYGYIKLPFYCL